MGTPLPTWTRVLALLAVFFAVVSTGNAINKGGDAAVFFEGGRRFLAAEPLYAGSSAADGFIGPPFQAAFFAPFAALAAVSPTAARLLWHALNLACFALGVWWSLTAWNAARWRLGLPELAWLPMLFAPLFAILLPLQTNFEHQNMNALLLAFIAGATVQLLIGSTIVAGVFIGVAAALKAFPALLIVYLLVRRQWTAALAAISSAAALSIVLPLGVYGYAGFVDLAKTFWRLGNSGWPVRGNNQSLIAAIDRLTMGHFGAADMFGVRAADLAGVRTAAEAPVATAVFAVVAGVLLLFQFLTLLRTPRAQAAVPVEMASVTVLAILLSPIAWDHYWTMMFPAFLIIYGSSDRLLLGRGARWLFWAAAVLTSGLSPLTLGRSGFNLARALSVDTLAALVLFVGLTIVATRSQPAATSAPHAND
jgi:alpha-1,2-mannosyltransferase